MLDSSFNSAMHQISEFESKLHAGQHSWGPCGIGVWRTNEGWFAQVIGNDNKTSARSGPWDTQELAEQHLLSTLRSFAAYTDKRADGTGKAVSVNARPDIELLHKLADQLIKQIQDAGRTPEPFTLTHDEIDAWRNQFDGMPIPVGLLRFRGIQIKEVADENFHRPTHPSADKPGRLG